MKKGSRVDSAGRRRPARAGNRFTCRSGEPPGERLPCLHADDPPVIENLPSLIARDDTRRLDPLTSDERAELLSINLRHSGFEVTIASTADQAQAAIDKVLPDLVLLDWMLPGQSGLQLAKRWRSEARTRELPIIMLTARVDEGDKINGLDAGADDYLTKPFSTKELLARMRAVLRRKAPEALDSAVEVAGLRLEEKL